MKRRGAQRSLAEQPRAVRVGRVTAVAHPDAASVRDLADRFRSYGYAVRNTPHFAMCRSPRRGGRTYVMHTFSQATVDEDVAGFIGDELAPLGFPSSQRDFGDALFGIVASTSPPSLACPRCGRLHLDHPQIWRHFSLNSLERLRRLLQQPSGDQQAQSHLTCFAAIYRRIIDCRAGTSLLDIGSNLGLLPVLLADGQAEIVGCDNRPEAVACAADLATAARAKVSFVLRDVLASDFAMIGRHDTVTAVHLLEHLREQDVAVALSNMLSVTKRRLIIAVPYETETQVVYGHVQSFTRSKLESWGRWCVETVGGGEYWTEDVSGGFLVIDRLRQFDSPLT